MDTLRARCPWDRVQTHASLMPHLVEESYEVLDALARWMADRRRRPSRRRRPPPGGARGPSVPDRLSRPPGHEAGRFDLADVARGVHDKLVHRHPHVFGDVDVDDVRSRWSPTGRRSRRSEKGRSSVTDGIPAALPALMLTTKLARKARAVGLEPLAARRDGPSTPWPLSSAAPAVLSRVPTTRWPAPPTTSSERWATSSSPWRWLAQRLGIDPEQALRDRALALRADIAPRRASPTHAVGNR